MGGLLVLFLGLAPPPLGNFSADPLEVCHKWLQIGFEPMSVATRDIL